MKKIFKILFWLAIIWVIMMFWVFMVQSAKASWAPLKKNTTPEIQEKINMVWHYSQDPAVVLTFERESGFANAISPYNLDGSRDYSECQLNSRYHWAFISSPAFQDWRERIAYCMEVYSRSGGKSFNGYFVRNTVKNRFIFFNN